MKKYFKIIVLILTCFSVTAQKVVQVTNPITASNDYLPKTIIIKVKPAFANVCSNNKIDHPTFNALATAIGSTNLHEQTR